MNVLGIRNCQVEGFGRFETILQEKHARFSIVHPYRGQELPQLRDFDAVIVGGTPISARAIADHPFLQEESRFPVFQWHADTFTIPAGGDRLVTGSPCQNQMFRQHSVVGMQFHLEVFQDDARAWANAYKDGLVAFGKTEQRLIEELAPQAQEMGQLCDLMITNLLFEPLSSSVRRRAAGRR